MIRLVVTLCIANTWNMLIAVGQGFTWKAEGDIQSNFAL
jgi:hypothetical protein